MSSLPFHRCVFGRRFGRRALNAAVAAGFSGILCATPAARASQASQADQAAPAVQTIRAADPLQELSRPYRAAATGALPVAPYVADSTAPEARASRAGDDSKSVAASLRWSVLTQDITLAHTLERWAAQAGYRVKWDAQRNFLIGAPDTIEGSFETALQTLLGSAGIRLSDYPLEACIYANTPPLVRITRQGEQARECAAQ